MSVQGTVPVVPAQGRGFRAYSAKHLDQLTARAGLDDRERLAVRAVATVLPFRTNDYVLESLIDWSAAPDDPIYRLVFPQADMLPAEDIAPIMGLLASGAPEREIQAAAHEVRMLDSVRAVLTARYHMLRDAERHGLHVERFWGLPEDRYVSAFLDRQPYAECVTEAKQRRDARISRALLDADQHSAADTRPLGQLVQGPAPAVPSLPDPAADRPGDAVRPGPRLQF